MPIALFAAAVALLAAVVSGCASAPNVVDWYTVSRNEIRVDDDQEIGFTIDWDVNTEYVGSQPYHDEKPVNWGGLCG